MRRTTSEHPELPGYTFVKLLGSGGFSDVFLYEQRLPRRRVAVKVLLTDELTAAGQQAFVSEANVMAQLSAHPYIVTIYHADVAADDRPYFVMEYCSGPSLGERYKRETFAVADVLRTGVRLSSAIATAHGAGILHRDIKPANVLSNDYGWPALTDFGISSALDDDAFPSHTITVADGADTGAANTGSQAVGMSVPWSPPEMFEDDPQPDVRSDVFSLAATIYTILAGQSPFEVRGRSNGTLDLIGRIERGAITPMTRTDVPRSLLAVLQKGMATDRNDRFASATDFARALQRVELELGYAPTTIEVPTILVDAPDRDADSEDDDATRVRSVATIEAQPAAPVTPRFTAPPLVDDDEATRVRPAQNVVAQPDISGETVVRAKPPVPPIAAPASVAPARPEPVASAPIAPMPVAEPTPPPAPTPAAPRTSTAQKVIVGVSAAAVLLIAAVVTVSLVLGNTAGPDSDTANGSDDPAVPVVPESIPEPTIGDPEVNGSSVVFPVEATDAEEGDFLLWQISNRTSDEPKRRVEGDSVTVEDYAPGSTICISLETTRAGKTSSPVESCYP